MPVKHQFVSSVTDIGGPTYVQPTHWNQPHVEPPRVAFSAALASAQALFTSMASAYTAGPGVLAGWYEFTNVTQVRLTAVANSAGFASAQFLMQFSGDAGVTWLPLATGATGPFVGIGSGAVSTNLLGPKIGSWFAVNPSAVAAGTDGVALRIVGFMGDGSVSPRVTKFDLFVL